MDFSIQSKINRLNELYLKKESGLQLNSSELEEQGLLREEIIDYFKFSFSSLSNNRK